MRNERNTGQVVSAAGQSQSERKFWLNKLSGPWQKAGFPHDRYPAKTGGNEQGTQRDTVTFALSPLQCAALMKLRNNSDIKLNMILTALVVVLLHKYTGHTDMVLGQPIYKQETEGNFINTVLALRIQPEPGLTFKELLLHLRKELGDAAENQNYPLETLPYELNMTISETGFPLFDTVVLLKNIHTRQYIEHLEIGLIFSFTREGSDIKGEVEYNRAMYDPATIRRIVAHCAAAAEAALTDVNRRLSEIDLATEQEKRQLLVEFNSTVVGQEFPGALHYLFEEQVGKTPDHIVLRMENRQLSYRGLNAAAAALTRRLQRTGVRPGSFAALVVRPSLAMAAAILGTLKAGAAYLPMAPGDPPRRIDYMLEDTGAKVLLTDDRSHFAVPMALGKNSEVLDLDPLAADREGPALPPLENFSASPAYVIYTSGTTGRPKAVVIDHGAAVNTIACRRSEYEMKAGITALQLFSYTFDGFVTSFFTPVVSGAESVFLGDQETGDIAKIKEAIVKYRVTHFISVPQLYLALIENLSAEEAATLEVVTLAGDKVSPRIPGITGEKNRNIELVNEYGVTEAAVMSTIYRHQEAGKQIRIGRPTGNTKIYILDPRGKLQPIGIFGELSLGGAGLARGYLNKPELTAEKFCLRRPGGLFSRKLPPWTPRKSFLYETFLEGPGNLFSKRFPGRRRQRLYKTGDMARWLPDGTIELAGRLDNQVKLRGYRLECGEIENRLLEQDYIKEAVVQGWEDSSGEMYLCAYIVAAQEPDETRLRENLLRHLPAYMIPSFFIRLETIPLSANGKIDRSALPKPQKRIPPEYTAPCNETEETLVEIWSEELGIEKGRIGTKANFFDLGGQSIIATIITTKIHHRLRVPLPLAEVFRTPTIRELAEYIMAEETAPRVSGTDNPVFLRKGTLEEKNLFLIHDGSGEVEAFVEFSRLLNPEFNCWGVRADRLKNSAPQIYTIEEIAGNYLEKITAVQPEGPYYVAGWCAGGPIAFEVVRRLEQMRRDIAFLGIISAYAPQRKIWEGLEKPTLQSEADFIQTHLLPRQSEIKQKIAAATDLNQLYSLILDYLHEGFIDSRFIKKIIEQHAGIDLLAIPLYEQQGIKGLIYYLNMFRTWGYARSLYEPTGKIDTPIHYFAASQTNVINKESWQEFTRQPVTFYEITGHHYTIFLKPQVRAFAKMFSGIISGI